MEQITLTIQLQWSPSLEISWCSHLFGCQLTQTADLPWFSRTTTSRAQREWFEKEKISSEQQSCGWNETTGSWHKLGICFGTPWDKHYWTAVLLLICCLLQWVVCIALSYIVLQVTADPVCTYGKLKVGQCVCRGDLIALKFSMLLSWNPFHMVISKTLHSDVKCGSLTWSVRNIAPCVACHLPFKTDVLQVWLEGWWATGLHLPTFILPYSHTRNCFWFSLSLLIQPTMPSVYSIVLLYPVWAGYVVQWLEGGFCSQCPAPWEGGGMVSGCIWNG